MATAVPVAATENTKEADDSAGGVQKDGVLIYGVTGVTGRLVAKKVKELGLKATLAGRNLNKVESISKEVGLPFKVFDLSDKSRLEDAVSQHVVVLHIAGPFNVTARPMLEACLKCNTHYLDVTGEFDVLELAKSFDERAKERGVMLLPAVGFDVIPGDCLAAHVKSKLAAANELHLATFIVRKNPSSDPGEKEKAASSALPSKGTMRSAVLHIIPKGGAILSNNSFSSEPIGRRIKSFEIGDGGPAVKTMSFRAAELFAAAHSTSIPNITVYVPGSSQQAFVLAALGLSVKIPPIKWLADLAIHRLPETSLADGDEGGVRMVCAAEAWDGSGGVAKASVSVSQGYKFTASSSVEVARRVLSGSFRPGYQTPASAYGSTLVEEIPGEDVNFIDII